MQEKDFITYEYKTKSVKAGDQTRAIDLYEAFGWEVTAAAPSVTGGVTLSLKRDRKQRHKQELNKLERQAEDVFFAIDKLHRAKTASASVFAYTFGSISTLILGGGMSLVMIGGGGIPAMVGGILLGVVGIVMCAVNYPIYKKIAAKKTAQVLPAIDENEEKLSNLLEKGNDLLTAEFI